MEPNQPERPTTPETPSTPAAPAEPAKALDRVRRARQRRLARAIVVVVIAILLLIFVLKNSQPVEVNFVFDTAHPRLIWVMIACILLGGIVGYLLGRPGKEGRPAKRDGKTGDR